MTYNLEMTDWWTDSDLNDTDKEGSDAKEDARAMCGQRMLGVWNRPGKKQTQAHLGNCLDFCPKKTTVSLGHDLTAWRGNLTTKTNIYLYLLAQGLAEVQLKMQWSPLTRGGEKTAISLTDGPSDKVSRISKSRLF